MNTLVEQYRKLERTGLPCPLCMVGTGHAPCAVQQPHLPRILYRDGPTTRSVQRAGETMLLVVTGRRPELAGHERRNQTFRWLAAFALLRGLDCVVVSPANVRYQRGVPWRVFGWQLNCADGEWERVAITLQQPVWLDLMYLEDIARQRTAYRRLQQQTALAGQPYVNPPLPGKDELYRLLSGRSIAPACIPETQRVDSVQPIWSLLADHGVVWLKPTFGSGGRNIVRVTSCAPDVYRVESEMYRGRRLDQMYNAKQLKQFVDQMIRGRPYLAQEPLWLLTTDRGQPVDLRVTVQRDGAGAWRVTATTVRIGREGSLLTNAHAGGTYLSWAAPSAERVRMLSGVPLTDQEVRRAERSAIRAAGALEAHFPLLGFLGMDVTPTRECCFVYDFNTKPGRDILSDAELSLMMARHAAFAAHLQKTAYGSQSEA
ncbi:MAG: YheC/YheD family protein [Alicyclobacillus sp.]|nr:YheC/YheD family protein [Alicyclobacillus sp.]